MTPNKLAVIGGGLTGLTTAIRAAQKGYNVDLYESAPTLGGRTRSFFHTPTQTWVDNGPHLLIGVYQQTLALLTEVGASSFIQWQDTLTLPLWDMRRGHFALTTSSKLPFSMALIDAVLRMPQHGLKSLPSLIRLAISMKFTQQGTVSDWMNRQRICSPLQRDMIEVLCLGAMNEPMQSADAASFCYVLNEAFSKHIHARLGWFTQPLSQALIQPLEAYCQQLGIRIHTSSRIVQLTKNTDDCTLYTRHKQQVYDHIMMATSASIRNQLLGIEQSIETQSICNVHLWFKEKLQLEHPFIGGVDTYGQWFFDVSQQHHEHTGLSHLCVVISADQSKLSKQEKIGRVLKELQAITQQPTLKPIHHQMITVKDATHVVRSHATLTMPTCIMDACEQPQSGELPATIETAVLRGEEVARKLPNINL
ncbi:MAG: FAD-dependent oxidoreductase [Mariprofundaceae bacterium]|nr:FAD-dependent oxidoreductase [Mariprofundaceae bacterium]